MLKNKEIAEILHISPAAVSLAINDKVGVSEETRRRVFALRNGSVAAQFSQLQQKNMANGMLLFLVLKKHGNVIGDTPFFLSLSEALYQQASVEGFNLQISYYRPGTDFSSYLHSLNVGQYEGVLILGTEAEDDDIRRIADLGRPNVIIDAWFQSQAIDSVLMDNESGIIQAMNHAYECGHRNIGFLRSSVKANNFDERYWAYRRCLDQLGLPFDARYVYSLHSTVKGARSDMSAILDTKPALPTLLMSCNDIMAMGAMDALSQHGYQIPRDISIIGFDDMPTSAFLNPPLTSVRIYNRRIAELAVELLANRIRNKSVCTEWIRSLVGVDLKVRKSVLLLNE